MVYSESENKGDNPGSLVWKVNIPFSFVSKEMIEQIKDREYAYDSYLKWGEVLSKIPTFWNIGLVDNCNNVYMFAYGTFNPLDSELEIKRAVVNKKFYSINGELLTEGLEQIKSYGKAIGIKHIYWITPRWKVFRRKMLNKLRLKDFRLLEVI